VFRKTCAKPAVADINATPVGAAAVDRIRLHASWKKRLLPELTGERMLALRAFLSKEREQGRTVYPPPALIFNALDCTPFDAVRVVILGQDPYIGPGQAHGLSFSVPQGIAPPPSLNNVFAELERDVRFVRPGHGNLSAWAQRGVLLLNSVLTVAAGQSGSHQNRGWEEFTDRIVDLLVRERENLVFLLWGSYAIRKGRLIDRSRHCVLSAPHPSPLSAHRGFIGCGHFSKSNAYFRGCGLPEMDWSL
jgi:uracil-DNA glycosylase